MKNNYLTSCTLVIASFVFLACTSTAQDGTAVGEATSRFDPVAGDVRRPDFTLTDLQCQSSTMDERDGKDLLVDFSASRRVP